MRAVCGVCALSILLAASGVAQDARPDLPRGKALGEVRGKDGKPWVGATVFLRSWPLPENIRVGSPDVVETRTDERGRFRARILEGRQYTVWAQGQPDADGKVRLSNVVEQVVVQMPVLLYAAKEPVAPRKAMITGLDKWSDYQPFRIRLVDEISSPRVWQVPGTGDHRQDRGRRGVCHRATRRHLSCPGQSAPGAARGWRRG
ncbi:MAG: carboxypeptidase-like regulatory domain-containing protein [Planctomycetota bacterium]